MTQLGSAVPGEAFALVRGVVNDVVFAENAPGLISVGALLAAWAGSNVFSALIDAMNRAYDIEERRPWWKKKLVALTSVLVTGITVGLATTILLSGEQIVNVVGNAIGLGPTAKALWTFLQIPLALTMLVTTAALSLLLSSQSPATVKKACVRGCACHNGALGACDVRIPFLGAEL
jgi:membrane protein